MNEDHTVYMEKCFSLALKAKGKTSPNPLVGCVIVKRNRIIAEGYHKKSGLPHAEADAFLNATEDVSGATLYCNLEPCCHLNKKTPPCAQAIIKHRIKKVVIANLDPNPEVAGQGVELLRQAGIEVEIGVLKNKGLLLNEVFFYHIKHKKPFIHLKWAQTLDGQIATRIGKSKWITSDAARSYVHQERSLYDAILVGAQTIRNDNPSLTIRTDKNKLCPFRLILTKSGNLPKNAQVLTDEFKDRTIIISPLQSAKITGVQFIKIPEDKTDDFQFILKEVYKRDIYSVYIEGGSSILTQALKTKSYQRISAYIAPKLLGSGVSAIGDLEILEMDNALLLKNSEWKVLEKDIVLESQRNICLQDL